MIIPLTIESSTSEQLNDFFDSDLTFTQTSLNKNKNLMEESEGIFKRLEDNSILIEISTPFRENYFIDENKIEIHDLDFDQVRIIRREDIKENIFLGYLVDGFDDSYISSELNDYEFKLKINEQNINLKFISKNHLQVKFKDNMDINNLINFYK
tara:strand:- start:208 stop:669 length:462 start_codon:yes stop_codon:yes gene_type:complete